MDKYEAKLKELEACVYGTPVERDPAAGLTKQKHAADGWRAGVSHPFQATKKRTFDVLHEYNGKTEKIELDNRCYGNFEALKKVIRFKQLLEDTAREKAGILAKLEVEKDLSAPRKLYFQARVAEIDLVTPHVEKQLEEFIAAGYDVEV